MMKTTDIPRILYFEPQGGYLNQNVDDFKNPSGRRTREYLLGVIQIIIQIQIVSTIILLTDFATVNK